jgi:hypothetical protein
MLSVHLAIEHRRSEVAWHVVWQVSKQKSVRDESHDGYGLAGLSLATRSSPCLPPGAIHRASREDHDDVQTVIALSPVSARIHA